MDITQAVFIVVGIVLTCSSLYATSINRKVCKGNKAIRNLHIFNLRMDIKYTRPPEDATDDQIIDYMELQSRRQDLIDTLERLDG